MHFLDIHTTPAADLRAIIDQALAMKTARGIARAARPMPSSRLRAAWSR